MIEDSLVAVAKENQIKNVEALRKKGVFMPEMSNKQISDLKLSQRKVAKSAAPGGAKKAEDGKKKK